MTIYGINPLDSDNALGEYRSIMFSLLRRVNFYIAGPSDPEVVENCVLGDIYAILALCKAEKTAGNIIAKRQVAEWREKFLEWLESSKRKIPEKYFEGYRETACRLFDELDDLAVKKPRDMWHTKAHPQGMS